jgi:hypothetical protein
MPGIYPHRPPLACLPATLNPAQAGDRVTEAIKQLAESHPQHVMRRVNQERKQAKEIETQRYQTDNEIQVESGAV